MAVPTVLSLIMHHKETAESCKNSAAHAARLVPAIVTFEMDV
jgi:hypothetical protein